MYPRAFVVKPYFAKVCQGLQQTPNTFDYGFTIKIPGYTTTPKQVLLKLLKLLQCNAAITLALCLRILSRELLSLLVIIVNTIAIKRLQFFYHGKQ